MPFWTLDLVHLAEGAAYDWAVLVAGDRDLAEAVWTAQDEGRRIILAVPPGAGTARELRRQADDIITIPVKVLREILIASNRVGASATSTKDSDSSPSR